MTQGVCTYPRCKCIVSTSTSQPDPICPLGLSENEADEPPSKCSGECNVGSHRYGAQYDERGFCAFCGEDGNA